MRTGSRRKAARTLPVAVAGCAVASTQRGFTPQGGANLPVAVAGCAVASTQRGFTPQGGANPPRRTAA